VSQEIQTISTEDQVDLLPSEIHVQDLEKLMPQSAAGINKGSTSTTPFLPQLLSAFKLVKIHVSDAPPTNLQLLADLFPKATFGLKFSMPPKTKTSDCSDVQKNILEITQNHLERILKRITFCDFDDIHFQTKGKEEDIGTIYTSQRTDWRAKNDFEDAPLLSYTAIEFFESDDCQALIKTSVQVRARVTEVHVIRSPYVLPFYEQIFPNAVFKVSLYADDLFKLTEASKKKIVHLKLLDNLEYPTTLSEFPNLETLHITDNQDTIDVLDGLDQLKTTHIDCKELINLEGIQEAPNLRKVSLSNIGHTQRFVEPNSFLAPLALLKSLTVLRIGCFKDNMSAIDPLALIMDPEKILSFPDLQSLREIEIGDGSFCSLNISHFPALTQLRVTGESTVILAGNLNTHDCLNVCERSNVIVAKGGSFSQGTEINLSEGSTLRVPKTSIGELKEAVDNAHLELNKDDHSKVYSFIPNEHSGFCLCFLKRS
jgi:hypothetical protein